MLASIILSLALALLLSCNAEPTERGQKCVKMKLSMCALALNGFTHKTTVSAMSEKNNIDNFNALINVHWSRFTRLFVCLTHYPFCSADAKIPLLLCGSICEDVFNNCIKYYIALKLDWSQQLNCSNFPRHPALCIKPSSSTPSSTTTSSAQEPATHLLQAVLRHPLRLHHQDLHRHFHHLRTLTLTLQVFFCLFRTFCQN